MLFSVIKLPFIPPLTGGIIWLNKEDHPGALMKKYNTPLHLLFEGGQVNPPFIKGDFYWRNPPYNNGNYLMIPPCQRGSKGDIIVTVNS